MQIQDQVSSTVPQSIKTESPQAPSRNPHSLPEDFDPGNYPHYSVQSSVYSLLLSALSMSMRYERFPGLEDRQEVLDALVLAYQDTCEILKTKP